MFKVRMLRCSFPVLFSCNLISFWVETVLLYSHGRHDVNVPRFGYWRVLEHMLLFDVPSHVHALLFSDSIHVFKIFKSNSFFLLKTTKSLVQCFSIHLLPLHMCPQIYPFCGNGLTQHSLVSVSIL